MDGIVRYLARSLDMTGTRSGEALASEQRRGRSRHHQVEGGLPPTVSMLWQSVLAGVMVPWW